MAFSLSHSRAVATVAREQERRDRNAAAVRALRQMDPATAHLFAAPATRRTPPSSPQRPHSACGGATTSLAVDAAAPARPLSAAGARHPAPRFPVDKATLVRQLRLPRDDAPDESDAARLQRRSVPVAHFWLNRSDHTSLLAAARRILAPPPPPESSASSSPSSDDDETAAGLAGVSEGARAVLNLFRRPASSRPSTAHPHATAAPSATQSKPPLSRSMGSSTRRPASAAAVRRGASAAASSAETAAKAPRAKLPRSNAGSGSGGPTSSGMSRVDKINKYTWDVRRLAAVHPLPKDAIFHSHVAIPAGTQPWPGTRVALVIGVGSYDDAEMAPTPACVRDAETVLQQLIACGYTVRAALSTPSADVLTTPGMRVVSPTVPQLRQLASEFKLTAQRPDVQSAVAIVVGVGAYDTSLTHSNGHLRLLCCEDSTRGLSHTYFPVHSLLPEGRSGLGWLVASDVSGLSGHAGYADVWSDADGGMLAFRYPPQMAKSQYGVCDSYRGVLVSCLARAFAGKALRDGQLTPNSVNVFVAERLAAKGLFKPFTTATPLQNGTRPLVDHAVASQLRQSLRAYRVAKRLDTCALKLSCLVVEEYARDLNVVASQLVARLKTQKKLRIDTDGISVHAAYPTLKVLAAFRTPDAYSMGAAVIAAWSTSCRLVHATARHGSTLAVCLTTTSVANHVAVAAQLRAFIAQRSLAATVLIDADVCLSMSQRARAKLMRHARWPGVLPSYVFLRDAQNDPVTLRRITAAVTWQRCWRRRTLLRRITAEAALMSAHRQTRTAVFAEWERGVTYLAGNFERMLRMGAEADEAGTRRAVQRYEAEQRRALYRERVDDFVDLVWYKGGGYAYRGVTPKTRWTDAVTVASRGAIADEERRARVSICEEPTRRAAIAFEQHVVRGFMRQQLRVLGAEITERAKVLHGEYVSLLQITSGARERLVLRRA